LNETFERPFRGLLSSIAPLYPHTASLLESVQAQFGWQAAFHASEVILCLQARVDTWGIEAAGVLTDEDYESLPFFETMQDNLLALERMVDVLECYASECHLLDALGVG
jgi:hypothetical protein